MSLLRKSMQQMGMTQLENQLQTYVTPSSNGLVRLSQFCLIFRIDERVRNACFIELCRQSDNLQGFPSHLLFDLMEKKDDPKQLSSHKINIDQVDPDEPEI